MKDELIPASSSFIPHPSSFLPRVTDFGLAKRVEGESQGLTATGQVLGTPSYMPPEQAAGDNAKIGPLADVYALGAVLYSILTGRPPFQAASAVETLLQVMTRDPASPRQLNPAVPRDLETIALKCLEKHPARRYQSAQALADELQRFLDGRPIVARPLSAAGRAWRWCRRNRALAATIAAAACLILALSAIYVVNLNAKNVQLAASLASEETARQQAQDNARQANAAWEREKAERLATERQSRVAHALRLAAQSQQVLNVSPPQSLLLAVEALETTLRHGEPRLAAAEQALRDSLASVGGKPLLEHTGPIYGLAISPDGHWLAAAGLGAVARLWDLTAKDPAAKPVALRGHEWPIRALAISPDSRWLVTGSNDRTARVWDLIAKDPAATSLVLRGHDGEVTAVAISPDSRWLVTASNDKTARQWDLSAKDPSAASLVLRGHAGTIRCLAISPDNRWLATGSEDHTVRRWDLTSRDPGTSPLVLRASRWLVTRELNSPLTARLWDLTAQDPAATSLVLRGHQAEIVSLAISPNSRWLATGSQDRTARVWDLTAKDPAATSLVLRGDEERIRSVAISPDSRWLVTVGGEARVWDLMAQDPVATPLVLRGHRTTRCAAISPDGRWLVTGGNDKTARVWDLAANDPAATAVVLRGHDGPVQCLAISPDSRQLVSGSLDRTARLWDLTVQDPAATSIVFGGHEGDNGVDSVAISPDSRWVVTTSRGAARLWPLRLEELMDLAWRTAGRELTGWWSWGGPGVRS